MVAILGRWDIFEAFNKIHPIANYNCVFRDTAITPLILAEQHGHADVAASLSKKFMMTWNLTTETENYCNHNCNWFNTIKLNLRNRFPKMKVMRSSITANRRSAVSTWFEYGNAMALTVIAAALQQAGFADAAVLLQRDQPNPLSFQSQSDLSTAEKRGFLQAVSAKGMMLLRN